MKVENGVAVGASVDMDPPRFEAEAVPVLSDAPQELILEAAGRRMEFFCLSMGNPHAVTFDWPEDDFFYKAGPVLERHPLFPDRANIEFAEVLGEHEMRMRVWERGSGETMACGTGATACAVAAICKGLCKSPVLVHLPGGDLTIEWHEGESAFMTGPAFSSFSGDWPAILA